MVIAYISLRKGDEEKRDEDGQESRGITLLLFYLPFVFCFVVSNVAKLAPWEWDNIKVLIYWFIGSIPFIALALAWAWEKKLRIEGNCDRLSAGPNIFRSLGRVAGYVGSN